MTDNKKEVELSDPGQINNPENNEELFKFLTSKENALKTAVILDNYEALSIVFVEKYVSMGLREWVKEKGFGLIDDEEGYFWYKIFPEGWKHHCIGLYNNLRTFYIGVFQTSGKEHKYLKLNIFNDAPNKGTPFGGEYCEEKLDSIWEIAKGEALQYIIETAEAILNELNDRREELKELNIEL